MLVGEMENLRRQFRGGQSMQVPFNLWPVILINVWDADGMFREANCASSVRAVRKCSDFHGFPSKQNV